MRVLAIETASEACSVALFDGAEFLAGSHRLLGRGHAERLVPMIADLPGRGRADRILVSLGPGSFTGVRIGLATARALGVAWNTEVLGYPTLALVAAMARGASRQSVTVCVNGGHGQWFVQNFDEAGVPEDEVASLAPADAARTVVHELIAGNRARDLAALVPDNRQVRDLEPDARETLALADAVMTSDLAPIYGRAPDAKPQQAAS